VKTELLSTSTSRTVDAPNGSSVKNVRTEVVGGRRVLEQRRDDHKQAMTHASWQKTERRCCFPRWWSCLGRLLQGLTRCAGCGKAIPLFQDKIEQWYHLDQHPETPPLWQVNSGYTLYFSSLCKIFASSANNSIISQRPGVQEAIFLPEDGGELPTVLAISCLPIRCISFLDHYYIIHRFSIDRPDSL